MLVRVCSVPLKQEMSLLVCLLLQAGHIPRPQRLNLNRIDVQVRNLHRFRVVYRVFGCNGEVMLLPVQIDFAHL